MVEQIFSLDVYDPSAQIIYEVSVISTHAICRSFQNLNREIWEVLLQFGSKAARVVSKRHWTRKNITQQSKLPKWI